MRRNKGFQSIRAVSINGLHASWIKNMASPTGFALIHVEKGYHRPGRPGCFRPVEASGQSLPLTGRDKGRSDSLGRSTRVSVNTRDLETALCTSVGLPRTPEPVVVVRVVRVVPVAVGRAQVVVVIVPRPAAKHARGRSSLCPVSSRLIRRIETVGSQPSSSLRAASRSRRVPWQGTRTA